MVYATHPFDVVGYDYLSLAGDNFIKATINLDYEIFNKNHVTLSAKYSNVRDNLFVSNEIKWFALPDYSGYAFGYSIETFLDSFEAKYTFSPETKRKLVVF